MLPEFVADVVCVDDRDYHITELQAANQRYVVSLLANTKASLEEIRDVSNGWTVDHLNDDVL